MRVDLFVIDGQKDFCASGDEPEKRRGALFVDGANEEANRVADMIKRLEAPGLPGNHKISKIHCSLDSHHKNDGSHNTSWRTTSGAIVDPFTIVSPSDAANQVYRPIFPMAQWQGEVVSSVVWATEYTAALEKEGRSPLCLWPPHCEIGKWGQNTYDPLAEAYDFWCDKTGTWIDWITKGQWPFTEHYSALKADVPDPKRRETQMNSDAIEDASNADIIVWSGWAGSHCLRWTGLDGVNFFEPSDAEKQAGATNEFIQKCVFLEDASAAVPNVPGGPDFGQWRREFLDEMDQRGAKISTTTDFLAS